MQQPDPGAAVDTATPEKETTAAAEAAAQPAIGSTSVGEVEKELDAALAKANENYELYLRAKADAENIRRRGQEEVSKAYKFAVESFAESWSPWWTASRRRSRSRMPPPSSCARASS